MIEDTSSLPQLWSCVECSFGVIAACVPSLTPLFLMLFNKAPARSRPQPYSYENSKQNRPSKNIRASFTRLGTGSTSHPIDQSLEMIMLAGQKGHAESSTEDHGEMESNIVVTSQLDQTSNERVDLVGSEIFGVQAQAHAV